MAEVPITEIPLDDGFFKMDPKRIKGHAPLFWKGDGHDTLIIRPRLCEWHTEGVMGEFALSLGPEDINCIDALWPNDADNDETEYLEVVGSISAVIDSLCEGFEDPWELDGSEERARQRALEWADHLEALARSIRARAERYEPSQGDA